jgi:hypothetical protein
MDFQKWFVIRTCLLAMPGRWLYRTRFLGLAIFLLEM